MLWNAFTWICFNVPWLLLAAAAALLLMKRKKSLPLMVQLAGAGGYFLVEIARWISFEILYLTHAGETISNAAWTIFAFLSWVCLMLFVGGYCWEKFVQWRETKMVPAVPVS